MSNNTPQSPGGLARAKQQRAEAEAKYYAKPNHCLQCGKVIATKQGEKVASTRRKKFCNHACAARQFNGLGQFNAIRQSGLTKVCKTCPKLIPDERSYCLRCQSSSRRLGRLLKCTKGELFASRKNWQSARSNITHHAARSYKKAYPTAACRKEGCDFAQHIEVCHIKAVADFPDTATIGEINALSNLTGLCPNHHWEFDHQPKD